MSKEELKGNIFDIVIIGGGPAGLTAGLYASRARMDVLLIESLSIMGQLTMTDFIENYPGIEKAGGFGLIETMKKQALNFGLKTETGTVVSLKQEKHEGREIWHIETDSGEVYSAISVVVASGAKPRKLGVKGEDELCGKGVSYCATCDAAFFRDKDIAVVGGGNTAVEEALFLTKFGRKVMVIHRRDRLRAAKVLQERAFENDKIEFIWNSVVEEIKGGSKVEKVLLKNVKDNTGSELKCDGIFVFAGWQPNTAFLAGVIDLAKDGSINVDESMKTSKEGLFACGDCCQRPLHQVITACGDGAIASQSAQLYVENLKGIAYDQK